MDCKNHKKEVAGVADMKVLAEMIGDLHYETLAVLLYRIDHKIYSDGLKDFSEGRTDLSSKLYRASHNINEAAKYIEQAWEISKPFMK